MPIDFFEKEVTKVQNRFSQTFGQTTVVNLDVRYNVMLTIIHLHRIAGEIRKLKPMNSREKVKEFMRCKAALDSVFTKLENKLNQRKELPNARDQYGTCHGARRYESVRDLR